MSNVVRSMTMALTLGAVPAFVASQWLALRWELPARPVFNAWILISAALILVGRRRMLSRIRKELWLTLGLAAAILLTVLVNQVGTTIAVRGTFPYVGWVLVLLAALVAPHALRTMHRGILVALGVLTAMALASLIQLALGAPAYGWLGQDLQYPRWWERGRATGLVANPGRLGQIGAIGIALSPLAGKRAAWLIIAAAIACAASGSRLVLVFVVVLLLAAAARRHGQTGILGWASVATLVAFVVVQVAVPLARQDLRDRTGQSLAGALTDTSDLFLDVRVENIRATFDLWQAYPVLGAGPGRFGSTTAFASRSPLHEQFGLPDVRSEEFVAQLRAAGDLREVDVGIAQLDVGWLQILSELGILGLILSLALLGALAMRSFRSSSYPALALLTLLALASVGGPGLVDFPLAAVILWWIGVTLVGSPQEEVEAA